MRRFLTAASLAALVLSVFACSNYGGSPSINPNSPSPPPADAIVIDIVGINGAQSFSPNPATVPVGKRVVWHNTDTVAHRMVFDDGELDTGTIGPGAFSAPTGLVASGPYHCSIHPPMIGAIGDGS
jgi:plastocyanin